MTEQTVPFGGTAVAEPPAPLLPLESDETGDADNRRKLVIVGAAVGVLVLVIAAWFLLKGGGSSDTASGLVPSHHVPVAGNSAAPAAAHPVKLPKAFKGTVGRDPFKALYVAPAGGGTTAGTTTATSSSTGSTTGTTTPTTTGSTTGTTTTPTATTPTYHPVWLQLKSVYGSKWANFVVGYSNGKTLKTVNYFHVMAPTTSNKTVFANVFALLSIQGGNATVQFGDGTPVDIAPGAGSRLVVA